MGGARDNFFVPVPHLRNFPFNFVGIGQRFTAENSWDQVPSEKIFSILFFLEKKKSINLITIIENF